jgi:ABC-type microcin C transport system permease subunit YejE
MPRGQFYTVFTLGFATALGLIGVLAGAIVLFWHEPVWMIVRLLGKDFEFLTPLYLAIAFAAAGIACGYWIVQIQQAVVHWFIDRLIAKLNEEYTALAQTLGTERADEVMYQRAAAMAEASHFDMFGRDEMLAAMRAAGQRPIS